MFLNVQLPDNEGFFIKLQSKLSEYIKLNSKLQEALKTTVNFIVDRRKEYECRIKEAERICYIRLQEGKMINETLAEMRGVFEYLMHQKLIANQTINTIPSFVDECLPYYCQGDTCFSPKTGETVGKIYETLKEILKGKNIEQDLVLCIFGVLNISKRANNPPKAPYIDINNFKRALFAYTNDGNNNEKGACLLKEAKDVVNKIKKEFTEFITDPDVYKNLESATSGKEVEAHSLPLINHIDTLNAASAIGTIEFIDKIAKYNGTSAVCRICDDDKPDLDIANKYGLVDVAEGNFDGGKPLKKKTKRVTKEKEKEKNGSSGVKEDDPLRLRRGSIKKTSGA